MAEQGSPKIIYRAVKRTLLRAEPSMRSAKQGWLEEGEELEVTAEPIVLPGLGIERVELEDGRGWCSLQNKEMEPVLKRLYEAPKIDEDVIVSAPDSPYQSGPDSCLRDRAASSSGCPGSGRVLR